jgi:hypothetical protein
MVPLHVLLPKKCFSQQKGNQGQCNTILLITLPPQFTTANIEEGYKPQLFIAVRFKRCRNISALQATLRSLTAFPSPTSAMMIFPTPGELLCPSSPNQSPHARGLFLF